MKTCKSCGAVVHIESNTCPNCGGHSFEVMDVKVCPLCGKVNGIESSFCEYCGKSFIGEDFGYPVQGDRIYAEAEELTGPEQRELPEAEQPFPTRRPLSDAERAMLHYLTLRPEIDSDGKEKKYAYYISDENVPIVILPTFDSDKEKNIKVEIMLVPERQAPEGSVVTSADRPQPPEEGMKIQLPQEKRKTGTLFAEHKVSRRAQAGLSLMLALFAVAAVVGFFLPLFGATKESGLSVFLGMLGYRESGAAVADALRTGGVMGKLTYVSIIVMYTLGLAGFILNLCFLRHSRGKKIILLILTVLAVLACVLCVVGNAAVLEITMSDFGYGFYVILGGLLLELLLNILTYNR